jgi:putative ABC transport system permease protein
MLARNPAFTVVALLTLAFGIGANTAIFSIVNAIVFQPLPYHAPEQLVGIWTRDLNRPGTQHPASLPTFRDWQQQTHVFSQVSAYAFNRFHVSGNEGPEDTRGVFATPNFFAVMGVNPILGRSFQPSDERDYVVVLGDALWRRRYNSDRNVIGKQINLNSETFTIIGVMRPSFRFPTPDIELWASMGPIYNLPAGSRSSIGDWINSRSLRGYRVVGRTQNGVSHQQAQAEMDTIAARLAQAYPDSDAGTGVVLVPLREQMVGTYRRPLLVLLAAVGFIMLILKQGALLTLAGLTEGIIGAFVLTRLLMDLLFEVKPTDPATYVIVSVLLAAVAIAACLIPSLRATKVDPLVALRYE